MPVLLNDGQIKEPVAATIGVFDGVHRGHRFVLSQLVAKARERGLNTVAITFKRHPLCVVRKDFRQQLLMGLDDRLAAIESMGIDYVVALDFTEDMSRMTAGQFLDFIHRHYSVRMLLTGYDNKFGSSRSDTFEDYVEYGKEVGVEVVRCNEFNPGGVKISSSEIRSRLAVGDVRSAAEMLGRRYRLSGTVVGGLENGRNRIPRLTLELSTKICPRSPHTRQCRFCRASFRRGQAAQKYQSLAMYMWRNGRGPTR